MGPSGEAASYGGASGATLGWGGGEQESLLRGGVGAWETGNPDGCPVNQDSKVLPSLRHLFPGNNKL